MPETGPSSACCKPKASYRLRSKRGTATEYACRSVRIIRPGTQGHPADAAVWIATGNRESFQPHSAGETETPEYTELQVKIVILKKSAKEFPGRQGAGKRKENTTEAFTSVRYGDDDGRRWESDKENAETIAGMQPRLLQRRIPRRRVDRNYLHVLPPSGKM